MPDGAAPRRVVVTGLGVVSNIGSGVGEFVTALRDGKTGTGPIRSFDTSAFPAVMAGEVQDFEPAGLLQRLDQRHWGRSALLAATAGRQAFADSGLDAEMLATSTAGSIMGTTAGEAVVNQDLADRWVKYGLANLDGELVAQVPASQIACAVSSELGLNGDTQTVPTACSAGNFAIGYAYDLVATGEADFMVAGGADSVNRLTHAGFYQMGALAKDVCRPFDMHRDGILTAEGSAALFLETLDHAKARDARIYAEVLGYGMNCDARHIVRPDADGIAECMRLAHRSAHVTPGQIDYICAHGTGTPTNDTTEIAAVRAVFGERIPPISSIKSMIGHTMGAASAIAAVACCLALAYGFLPPTANLRDVDPSLGGDIDCVPGKGRSADLHIVQNNGFAFGGNNVITILGRLA